MLKYLQPLPKFSISERKFSFLAKKSYLIIDNEGVSSERTCQSCFLLISVKKNFNSSVMSAQRLASIQFCARTLMNVPSREVVVV